MIEVAVRNILIGDATVSELVTDQTQQPPASRIWFVNRPQDERRAGIILNLISNTPANTLGGDFNYSSGRMQATCLASTYPVAKQLAYATCDALQNFSGTEDGTSVGRLTVENIRDLPVTPLVGMGSPASFGVVMDIMFLTLGPN